MLETNPISSLRAVELYDRGNIVQITGTAFVAGTLPLKVWKLLLLLVDVSLVF